MLDLSPHYPHLNEDGIAVPDHYLVEKHKPIDCPSDNHKSYQTADYRNQERFDEHFS